ncbi:hypothetical protein EHV15_28165 [Paenibacillus oralis]|uniref:Uncharacterized protein n=1 Tax=Paenibacillus oralis TaxID=2490856 RepID=A0A3P3U7M7_9BACL|nr:hypothetical protein [Paenibacillus oralis]RRJ66362.1 hypothetical protein EHV15_28165 [Paenibacillus oralis]
MRSSSFFGGVLVGAIAAMWASQRRGGMMSIMNGAGSALKLAGLKSDILGGGQGQHGSEGSESHRTGYASKVTGQHPTGAGNAQVYPSSVSASDAKHSKEYNLKQITDFIKSDAGVRREVEAILKETNTAIPGL